MNQLSRRLVTMKTYKAVREKIIVKVLHEETHKKTESGIYIDTDDVVQAFRIEAEVLDVGSAVFLDGGNDAVAPGDIVCIAPGSGVDLKAYEGAYVIKAIRDIDILCKIEY